MRKEINVFDTKYATDSRLLIKHAEDAALADGSSVSSVLRLVVVSLKLAGRRNQAQAVLTLAVARGLLSDPADVDDPGWSVCGMEN